MPKPRTYAFHSRWQINAPPQVVWNALAANPAEWPDWWPGLHNVKVIQLRPKLAGSRLQCIWRSPTGYRLQNDVLIENVAPNHQVTFRSTGDLNGFVACQLHASSGKTHIDMTWQVSTTKRWMNLTAFALRPIFTWSHHAVMRLGEQGLQHHLDKIN